MDNQRGRERLEGRVDADQMDYLFWRSAEEGISRNEALRRTINEASGYIGTRGRISDTEYQKQVVRARRRSRTASPTHRA